MKRSIFLIKATLRRHNALFHSNNEFLKEMVIGTGIVQDPLKSDKSKTGNKFTKNDVVLIVKAERKDQSKYPWLFTEHQYIRIPRKAIKEDQDGSIVVPGIKNLDRFDYLIKVALEWGGQYVKGRAQWTKKTTQSSTI